MSSSSEAANYKAKHQADSWPEGHADRDIVECCPKNRSHSRTYHQAGDHVDGCLGEGWGFGRLAAGVLRVIVHSGNGTPDGPGSRPARWSDSSEPGASTRCSAHLEAGALGEERCLDVCSASSGISPHLDTDCLGG